MKFVCERCHTKYSIADDKVRQKILKIRCKTCENVITIRDAVVVNEPRALSEPRGVRAVPPAPPVRAARAVEWHLAIEGRQEGPLPLPALVSRISAAARGAEIYIWNEHLDGWKEPKAVPEVAAELRGRATPPPPPPLPPIPGKRLPSPAAGRPAVFSTLGSVSARRSGTHGTVDAGVKPMAASGPAGSFGDTESERTQIQPPDAALLMASDGAAAALAPRPVERPAEIHPGRSSGAHPSLHGGLHPGGHVGLHGKANGSSSALPAAAPSSSGLEALDFVPGQHPGAAPAAPLGVNAAPAPGAVASSIMGASTSMLLAQVGGRAAKARHPAFKFVVTGGLLVGLLIVVAVLALSDRDRAGGVGKPALAEATPAAPAPEAEARARAEAEKYFKSMVGEKPAPPPPAPTTVTKSVGPPPRRPAQRNRNSPEVALAPPPLTPPPLGAGAQPAPDTTSVSRRFAQDERKVASPSTRSGRRGEATFDHQKFMGVFKQQDHHTAIKSCYERALKRDERLKLARLDISVNVGETGSVKKVRVDAPPEFNGVSSCIREAVRRWRFPSNAEEYEASFPLILHGNAD